MYTILRTNRANESQAGPKNDGMYKNQAHEAHEICEELVDDANDADVKNQLLTSWAKMDNLNALYQKSMEELHSLKQNHERALQKLQETNMDVNDLNFVSWIHPLPFCTWFQSFMLKLKKPTNDRTKLFMIEDVYASCVVPDLQGWTETWNSSNQCNNLFKVELKYSKISFEHSKIRS